MENHVRQIENTNGRLLSVVGDTYRIIIAGEQTNGEFAMIDMLIPPGGGPGPHAHAAFHESFYIMDGEVEFKTEEGKTIARKGDVITVPKGGAIHSFKNVSDSVAHMLCTVVPAGLDAFFEEIGTPVQVGQFSPPSHLDENSVKKLIAIAEKFGQQVYPPDYLDNK